MKGFKALAIIAMVSIILFNTAPLTVHAAENEATSDAATVQTFLPFRSYIASYITLHSTDKSQAIINEWLKIWFEETTFTGTYSAEDTDIVKWSKKYHSSYTLLGGIFVSDESATGTNVTFNSDFDQFLANTINANGFDFINQWIDSTNDAFSFTGAQVFIDYFKNSDYQNYPATAAAFVELTKTEEGFVWLQNYSYANTGDNENSIGISLLKLLSMNWSSLNENQQNWCKEYLPFLLKDYSNNGNQAIASNTTNPSLYDFMARSILGANYTVKSIVSGKTCQQEFFDYVVDSKEGFGEFLQNVNGGNTFTAITPNRTISGIDLSNVAAASGIFGISCADGDADYTSTSVGDGDFDWFGHGLYMQEKNKSCPDFSTVLSLIKNNSSTDWLYLDWISRFKSVNETSSPWATVTNYRYSSTTYSSGYGGYYYITGSGSNQNGPASSETSDGSAIYSAFPNSNTIYKIGTQSRNMAFILNNFRDIVIDYNSTISYKASSITVTFGSGTTMNYPGAAVLIQIISPSTNATVAYASCAASSSATIDIPDSAWVNDKYLKLRFTYNPYNAVDYAFNHSNLGSCYAHGYEWRIDKIVENFDGSNSGLDGYTWSDWNTNYSDDYSKVILYRNATTNTAIEESEVIYAQIDDYADRTEYTYTPTVLSKDPWTVTISKDLGESGSSVAIDILGDKVSGNRISSASTSYSAGPYSVFLANVVRSHVALDGNNNNTSMSNWIAQTTVTATASGTLNVCNGAIKSNVQSITVQTTHYATISLRSKNGEILATSSGDKCITLDVSNIDTIEKQDCYLVINYSGSASNTSQAHYNVWDYYPSASVSVVSQVSSINISY